jgi:hypothetical protein
MATEEYTDMYDLYAVANHAIDDPIEFASGMMPKTMLVDEHTGEQIERDYEAVKNFSQDLIDEPLHTVDLCANEALAMFLITGPQFGRRNFGKPRYMKRRGAPKMRPHPSTSVPKFRAVMTKGTNKYGLTHIHYKHTPEAYLKGINKLSVPRPTTTLFMSSSKADIMELFRRFPDNMIRVGRSATNPNNIEALAKMTNKYGISRHYYLIIEPTTFQVISFYPAAPLPLSFVKNTGATEYIEILKRIQNSAQ